MSRVLVVGGTGDLGLPVARVLRDGGHTVRLFSRRPPEALHDERFEIVAGDIHDRAGLLAAMKDCDAVHISLRGGPSAEAFEEIEHHGVAAVAGAAAEAGVGHLTFLSGEMVGEPRAAHLVEQRAKAMGERAVRDSGVPYTIFRPTYFMETLPRHIQGRRAIVIGRRLRPLHMIAAADLGRLVAAALHTPAARGKTLYVHGPQAITIAEALRAYCTRFAPGVSVVRVPISFMRILDSLKFKGELRPTIDLMETFQELGEVGTPTETEQLLLRPSTTFPEWLATTVGRGQESRARSRSNGGRSDGDQESGTRRFRGC